MSPIFLSNFHKVFHLHAIFNQLISKVAIKFNEHRSITLAFRCQLLIPGSEGISWACTVFKNKPMRASMHLFKSDGHDTILASLYCFARKIYRSATRA